MHLLTFVYKQISTSFYYTGFTECTKFWASAKDSTRYRRWCGRRLLNQYDLFKVRMNQFYDKIECTYDKMDFNIYVNHFSQEGDRLFHNIEMGPALPGENQSQLNVLTVSRGESIVHANKYESLDWTLNNLRDWVTNTICALCSVGTCDFLSQKWPDRSSIRVSHAMKHLIVSENQSPRKTQLICSATKAEKYTLYFVRMAAMNLLKLLQLVRIWIWNKKFKINTFFLKFLVSVF